MENLNKSFEGFMRVLRRLRNPGGCPWDIAQTPMTMRTPLLEETYETVDAVEEFEINGNIDHIREELGDVLLNTLMISYMFEQNNLFSISDVFDEVTDKLIRRHPHVFGETDGYAGPENENKPKTADSVLSQWDDIKEKIENRQNESILDSIPKSFPPLLRAYKLQKKSAKKGFDWNKLEGVKEKINEEIDELKEAIESHDKNKITEEFGDLLFSIINMGRKLKIDPTVALNSTNKKFEKRFRYIESKMNTLNIEMDASNIDKMDVFWEESKDL